MEDPSPSKKPSLAIDLNEAPPSPPPSDSLPPPSPHPQPQPNPTAAADALSLVLNFHGNPKPAGGPAAGFPGEAGVGEPRMCGICGRPEVFGGTVVCDGCEAGFHLGCLRSRQRQQALSGDWTCGECALSGPTQKRWVLGAAKLLDINEPPPGDEEEIGRMTNHDEAYSNGSMGRPHSYQNMVQVGSVADVVNHSGIVADTMQTGAEVIPHLMLNTSRGFEDMGLAYAVGKRHVISRATRSGPFTEEVFLNTLKNFILEKGGFLGEGWHVEFVQSPYGFSNPFALYCAPDGKKFDSMYDVAQYLGISSRFIPVEIDERSDGCGSVRRALPPRRRKKDLARISATSRFTENRDTVGIASREELWSDKDFITQYYDAKNASRVAEAYMEENGVDESPETSVGLPLQYEDFFVLRLGRIDPRAAYHGKHQIWPIGYRSIWHDKITGSLFHCEVSDGGDSGPVFKVRRSPCSLSHIPAGETVLLHNKVEKMDIAEKIECSNVIFDASSNEEDILILLSDPNPSEQEFFSCFGHDISGHPYEPSVQMDVEKLDRLTNNSNNHHGMNVHPSGRDEIGEFFVEGRSSSSVWKMVSRTLIDACHEVYKLSGCLQFCCRHDFGSSCSDGGNLKDAHQTGSLGRFCCACGPIETPRVIQNDIKLEASCRSLAEWLEQDRFGLDMAFVQEIIENLHASRSCSQYHCLIDRSDFKSAHTVGNGLFLPIQKSGKRGGEASYALYSGNNGVKLHDLPEESPLTDVHHPPGRPLSSKLPGELVGDVFQIWEFLWRFYEVLGLKEPLSFEELEEELIDPWPCDLNHLKKIEKDNQDCRDSVTVGTESANYPVSLSNSVTDSTPHGQNPFKLIPVETATTREATQIKAASHTYGNCNGVALTKAHISLLKVLVGELLNKVAVFLDPNFDARDSKPKRGRRKDVDTSPLKEAKHELLPLNELTWPELARRYALAVLSMNGRTEDVSSRESLRVYRCLQGDGGILCGSLSGIAGMGADALILADAEKQISGSVKQDNVVFTVDHMDTSAAVTCEPAVTSNNLPEWAQPLEPVRKLPTNVGTRIRKCVYSSLEKNPPEWAKEILEHSISKEVYKGNASGPTKKAVLSILAKLTAGTQQQKPEIAPRGKTSLSVSDIIMKKCRVVLRSAVSADESKTFCNLLGTTLLNSSDNNEKGILGSPAMVSRPLDFRTIDLRLAVGAYGGSYETFLEDVREVWRNLRIAYGDQPDLMQQLDGLSQNFESLYEKEVMDLVQKLAHHLSSEGLDVEIQKELNEVLLAGNNLPKAPWEDGVCKVCGIDKDDTSVLLCDKCDSEYHRYCLNPPLARIPDGDWFCPSCAEDRQKGQHESNCTSVVTGHTRRNLEDETQTFREAEAIHQLVSSMEVKEYWQFNTHERIFLLRFLCDEVLNSALIREHLEQCVDKSNNAQQKLYALTIDWRNLKCKEELLARTVKEQTGKSSGSRDFVREECRAPIHANQGRLLEHQQHSMNRAIYTTNFSGSPLKRASAPLEEYHAENGQTDLNQNFGQLLKSMIENHINGSKPQNMQNLSDSMAAGCGTHTVDGYGLLKATPNGNPLFVTNVNNDNGLDGQEQSAVPLQQGNTAATGDAVHGVDLKNDRSMLIGVGSITRDGLNANEVLSMEGNGMVQSISDSFRGSHQSLDCGRTHGNTLSMTMPSGAGMSVGELFSSHQTTVLQGSHLDIPASPIDLAASNLEVCSLRNEISQLQDSIANLESLVMSTSLRRDFLGRDSLDRLYWVIGKPGIRPWLVVGGSMAVPCEKRKTNEIGASGSCSTSDFASGSSMLGGNIHPSISQSHCSPNCSMWNSSPLVLYESDTEIQQLVNWLRDSDPREKELKEGILQWQRLAFYHENIYVGTDPKPKSSVGEKLVAPCCLITKAAVILENKYGPSMELEVSENPRKRGRKTRANNEEKMYRCECLEPVWPSRHHCLSCHQTFTFFKDLEDHNDGRCAPTIPAADESKETDDQVKGRGIRSDYTKGKESSDDADTVETSKKGKFDVSSNLVKFPKKACPYDLAEISRKFITNDSNKELVNEIGLIGSNGFPSLISSPMFFDLPLILKQSKTFDTHVNEGWSFIQSEGSNGSHGVGNKHGHDAKSSENCRDSQVDHLRITSFPYFAAGKHGSSKLHAEVTWNCTIPEQSLRPLVGRLSFILRQLKINLLDMEAALPEEALRHSKSHIMRRCAWRAYVKSAESIFEMIQATILFECMIKSDYLKNGWWYWSSLSAAAKTSTVSSLALRIYTLDDSIIYIKHNEPQTPTSLDPVVESLRITNKTAGKKRKDMIDGEPS